MAISIKPLEDRIVVQTLEAEQTTASGLVIPDTAKEKPQEGKVLAVGPGRVDDSGKRIPVDGAGGGREAAPHRPQATGGSRWRCSWRAIWARRSSSVRPPHTP